jgi:HSP20 family protein
MGLGYYMVKEVMREIGNKSREFYEFVLPPVDIVMQNDSLVVTIDMPGFDKKEIKVRIHGHILSINAKRETVGDGTVVWRQRPNTVDKKIRLPMRVKDEEDLGASAKYQDGVLTLTIPIKTGKNITIE